MRFNIDHDVFLSEGCQLRNELSDLGEVVSNEHLTTIILDALPEGRYSKLTTIFINHLERWSVPKRSQELYRKRRDSSRDPTTNGLESAIDTVITCHSWKRPGWKEKM